MNLPATAADRLAILENPSRYAWADDSYRGCESAALWSNQSLASSAGSQARDDGFVFESHRYRRLQEEFNLSPAPIAMNLKSVARCGSLRLRP